MLHLWKDYSATPLSRLQGYSSFKTTVLLLFSDQPKTCAKMVLKEGWYLVRAHYLGIWREVRKAEFLATSEACKVVFWPTRSLNQRTFETTLDFQQMGPQFLHLRYSITGYWHKNRLADEMKQTAGPYRSQSGFWQVTQWHWGVSMVTSRVFCRAQ